MSNNKPETAETEQFMDYRIRRISESMTGARKELSLS